MIFYDSQTHWTQKCPGGFCDFFPCVILNAQLKSALFWYLRLTMSVITIVTSIHNGFPLCQSAIGSISIGLPHLVMVTQPSLMILNDNLWISLPLSKALVPRYPKTRSTKSGKERFAWVPLQWCVGMRGKRGKVYLVPRISKASIPVCGMRKNTPALLWILGLFPPHRNVTKSQTDLFSPVWLLRVMDAPTFQTLAPD